MPEPFVRNTSTGVEPEPVLLRVLCNGDVSAKLARGGLDMRPYFHARVSHPVTFHLIHGHFEASLYRPTRRERWRGWWYAHGRALFWLLAPWLSALAFYLAVCLAMDAGNALADWVSALW